MRVLYFHQYFNTPSIGGGIRSYEFAQALVKKGHHVTMICGGADEKFNLPKVSRYFNRGFVDGVEVIQIRINTTNKDKISKRAIDFVKFGFLSIKFAFNEEYDLLFATSTPLSAGIPGIFAKWFSRKKFKFVFEVRDLWPELPKALGLKNPFLLWGMGVLEKVSYKKSDACIGLSPGICEGIKKKTPKGHLIEMIPNGCDIDLFTRDTTGKYEIEGIKTDDIVAIYPGVHGVANGLDSVLDMAKVLIEKEINHIKILFVGKGKQKPHLINRTSNEKINNCIFLDKVSKYELNRIMSRADIGLMVLKNIPAFYYGTSPNKFFDYISASLPIVNNYPGWLADMITEYKCGVVVPPDNPHAFADAVIELANDSKSRIQMGINSRAIAERKFSRKDLAAKFVTLLEEVAKWD
ncbi:glycosyltransferase family 4 protein [Agriterribacter humi]|uniref:glycosyltransferase family 4 protein n=1 Tax=Agriterribacter humi TaxID=1104781 RepID=UPI001264A90A|nr:glycosyltransferase family 4 protein [Agriterribacter humi]